ncbi:hypothetical protein LINGRAHAP2_LOCUS8735 [Linum grandiflorum]
MLDNTGNLIRAFTCNLGVCSITRSELRGAVEDFDLAWQVRFRWRVLQMDSSCAFHLLSAEGNDQHAALIRRFKES